MARIVVEYPTRYLLPKFNPTAFSSLVKDAAETSASSGSKGGGTGVGNVASATFGVLARMNDLYLQMWILMEDLLYSTVVATCFGL